MSTKVCTSCNKEKELSYFSVRSTSRDGYRNQCKQCMGVKQYNRIHRDEETLSKRKKQSRKSRKLRDTIIRKEVLVAYGNKCMYCNEHRDNFLTIDHIHNDGYIHRKELTTYIYRQLKRMNYPKDRFQILCYNCNLSKSRYDKNPVLEERRIKSETEGLCGEGI